MRRNGPVVLLVSLAISFGLSTPGKGASTEAVAAIHRAIPDGYVLPDMQRQHFQEMLVHAVDKDARGLVRYGKDCNADNDPRLSLCLSWSLYLADPAKYASQFVDLFPVGDSTADAGQMFVFNEYDWTPYIDRPGDMLPDPFTCLGQVADSGNKKAIEKLLLLPWGEGGGDTYVKVDWKYRVLLKYPVETIRIAARLFDEGKIAFSGDDQEFLGQRRVDEIKESVRGLLSHASSTEKGVIQEILDSYADEPDYTLPPYKRPLSDSEREHLQRMVECATAHDESGLEKYWGRMDDALKRNQVLALAHGWYLYTITPKKWRKEFVENYPSDFDGVCDLYRVSLAYCPKESAGSALKDLGRIAEEGDVRAIQRLVAGLRSYATPPTIELEAELSRVMERQPDKAVRALAVAGDGHSWVYSLADRVYRAIGGKRFVALRDRLQKLGPQANKKERLVLRGFMEFSTEKMVNLPPEQIVIPLAVPSEKSVRP